MNTSAFTHVDSPLTHLRDDFAGLGRDQAAIVRILRGMSGTTGRDVG